MGSIVMLSLYRCAENNKEFNGLQTVYFMMDYFDGASVEILDPQEVSLQECMGIKGNVNKIKEGISHQRFCLYTNKDEQLELWDPKTGGAHPILTIIQVFINPDVYQFRQFESGEPVSCDMCIKKVDAYIARMKQHRDFMWNTYRLVTAGDFAVVIRSGDVRTAYDVSSMIRNIYVADKDQKKAPAFFTYSMAGSLKEDTIDWSSCLGQGDFVSIRANFAKRGKELEKIYPHGHRLWGRYDFELLCSPKEFQELYGYIKAFKFGDKAVGSENTEGCLNDKTTVFLQLMNKGYISRISERILICCDSEEEEIIWEVCAGETWRSLYKENLKVIEEVKILQKKVEGWLEPHYQSAKNLKEYMRLLGRLRRILYEINQMQELRVSAANLLMQLKVMLQSMEAYWNEMKEAGLSREAVGRIEEFLQLGIGALEIFTRYIRNINLQTLHSTNYDLQTNMCIEKILLAYSQFLQPFMLKSEESGRPYHLYETLYPIVVPNTNARDLSVCVLFDDCHNFSTDNRKKFMVVYSPTLSYLCESCFMIPIIFHEIAHQFRYEDRDIRNRCLETCVMKSFLLRIVLRLLKAEEGYAFLFMPETHEIVDHIWKKIENQFMNEKDRRCCLRLFESRLTERLQTFVQSVSEREKLPGEAVRIYIQKTAEMVSDYSDQGLLDILVELEAAIEHAEVKSLKVSILKYRDLIVKQIRKEILNIIQKGTTEETADQWGKIMDFGEVQKGESYSEKNLDEAGRAMSANWEELKEMVWDPMSRNDLENLIRQYHSVVVNYSECGRLLDNAPAKIPRLDVFHDICSVIAERMPEILEKMERDLNSRMQWDQPPLASRQLEHLRNNMIIIGQEGIEEQVREILTSDRESVAELVGGTVGLYGEVTSDLFMCGIMGLSCWGYLVVAAENFVFNSNTEMALYRRIEMVLYSLISTANDTATDEIDEYLIDMLWKEAEILYENVSGLSENVYFQKDAVGEERLDRAIEFFDSLYKEYNEGEITSADKAGVSERTYTSQKWVIRIYCQISYIIYNITKINRNDFTIEMLLEDITGEQSYVKRQKDLQKMLKKSCGKDLCSDISSILNSPARYFKERKSLVSKEILFVLNAYEENCRQIFWGEEYMKEMYDGSSSI